MCVNFSQLNEQWYFCSNERQTLLDASISRMQYTNRRQSCSPSEKFLSSSKQKTKSRSQRYHTLYSSITCFDTFSSRYLSFRFVSFRCISNFYISIWKTKHDWNSFNIFDWVECGASKQKFRRDYVCWAKGMFWKDDWQNLHSSSFVRSFFTHESWFDVCLLLNHFGVATPKSSNHIKSTWNAFNQLQWWCWWWWWQNVYKPLNFTAQSIDAHRMRLCSQAMTRFLFCLRCQRWYFNSIVVVSAATNLKGMFFKQKSVFATFSFNYYFQFIIVVIIFFRHF